jgi:type VI secretion system protein ImpA
VAEIRAWMAERLATSATPPASAAHAPAADAPEAPDADLDAPADEPYDAPWPAYGPSIGSRDEAYALLDAAAGYLAATEPHSPAPWLVRRAVGWGGMELGELLESLIGEGYDLKSLRLLLGLAGEGRP